MHITCSPSSVENMYNDCRMIYSNLLSRGSSQYTKTKDLYEFYERGLNDIEEQAKKAKGRLFIPFIGTKPIEDDTKGMTESK